MISKCRPIEIVRKKFSDFDQYEKNENEVFLVGYEISQDGNKKNVKINVKDFDFGSSSSKSERKPFYYEKIFSNHHANDNGYISSKDDYHHKIVFNVGLGKYFEIDSVESNMFEPSECEDVDLIIDFSGTDIVVGESTKILMRDVCPSYINSVNIIVDDYCVAEVSNGETLIIDIFHTKNTEIVSARCEGVESLI